MNTFLTHPLTCLLSGALMTFVYAPFSQAWLVFFLLLPLWAVAQLPDPNTRIWRGLLFGIGYFPIGAYWFVLTLRNHLDYAWPSALGGHLLITGACALAPCVFVWLAGYCRVQAYARVLVFAALWLVIEDIRFQAFGGGPWMSLGLSQVDMPFAGFFPLVGELGTSFFVASIVGLLAMLIDIRRLHFPPLVIMVLLFAGAWGLKQIEWTRAVGERQTIGLVQTAVKQHEKKNIATQVERLQVLTNLTEPLLDKARFVIWPETVVTLERYNINQYLDRFHQQALQARSTVLVGAYEPAMSGKRYNTAYTLGLEAGQVYQKRHLVPFGEYVPDYLNFLVSYVPGDADRYHGKRPQLIVNSGVLYGVSICWEGSFSRDISPLSRAGAHALINIANEAWFAGSTLPEQNLDAMRVRAMENGRDAVRVANFGPGAIINAKGQISHLIGADQITGISGLLQPRAGATPFMMLGEDLITLAAFCIALLVLIRARKQDKDEYTN
jgi:apolipoprotein N-acyltransferase